MNTVDKIFEKAFLIGTALMIEDSLKNLEKESENLPYSKGAIHRHNMTYDNYIDWEVSINEEIDQYSDVTVTKKDLIDFKEEAEEKQERLVDELESIREDIALSKSEMDSIENQDHKSHKYKIYMDLIEEERLIKDDISDTQEEINCFARALQEYQDDLPGDSRLIEGSWENIQERAGDIR